MKSESGKENLNTLTQKERWQREFETMGYIAEKLYPMSLDEKTRVLEWSANFLLGRTFK